jgi:hypothetical protein
LDEKALAAFISFSRGTNSGLQQGSIHADHFLSSWELTSYSRSLLHGVISSFYCISSPANSIYCCTHITVAVNLWCGNLWLKHCWLLRIPEVISQEHAKWWAAI